jgi:hypothetical protein
LHAEVELELGVRIALIEARDLKPQQIVRKTNAT